ncbi:MAG: acyl-CoA dehydrogenase family protein [Deltaproteobacteria bacterium]|nr:acyl-CoA dehydrogenase family protein [Deltaproteobacteria bacterium]
MTRTEDTEISMLAQAAAEFAAGELAVHKKEADRFPFGPYFSDVLKKAFNLDFFHITLPDSMGGIGMNTEALCMVLDMLSRQDASLGAIILTHCFAQELLIHADAVNLLENRVKHAKTPENHLIAFPLFNNPSEIRHLARVEEQEGRFSLSGSIEYLVLGGIADVAIVPAAPKGKEAYSYYLVDLNQSSVSISEPVLSLGLRCCPAVDVEFHAAGAVSIGTPGDGDRLFQKTAAKLNAAAAAISSGIMKGSFDEALAYAQDREQGGRKLAAWSEMRKMLADMAVHIKIANMAVSEACRDMDQNRKNWEQNALAAAIHIQEAAVQVTTDGVQALGGVGYMQDFGQEKRFRDAKHIQACFGLTPMKRLKLLENIAGKER